MEEPEFVVPEVGERFVAEDGSVSIVLSDGVDENYVPTREEIEEFAKWMGMNLPEDNEFLHIAVEGLKAPLPKYWRPCRTEDDEIYYFNFKTGESTWCHPMDEAHREKFIKAKEEKRGLSGKGGANDGKSTGIRGGVSVLPQKGSFGGSLAAPTGLQGGNPEKPLAALGTKYPPLRSQPLPGSAAKTALPNGGESTTGTAVGGPFDGGGDGGNSAGGKRRFISETEEVLEKRIRQEREVLFLEEQKKAEAIFEERRVNMCRTHDEEVKKVRASMETKLAELRASVSERDAEMLERREVEAMWRERLDEVRKEEKTLEQRLASLREQSEQRIAAEIEETEVKAAADFEAKIKRIEADASVASERARDEAQVAFVAKKNELRRQAQEELQKLKEAAEAEHNSEMTELQQRLSVDGSQLAGRANAARENTPTDSEVDARVTALRAEEQQGIAAIRKHYEEENASLVKSMEGTVNALRAEICQIRQTVVSPAVPEVGHCTPCHAELEDLRRRWRAEEARQMQILVEDRQAKVLAQEKSLEAPRTPFVTATPVVSGEQSSRMRALLAVKEKEHQETEALLRATLQDELTRTGLPLEVQLEAAVDDAFKVFVKSTEVSRRLEREDFERRRAANSFSHVSSEQAEEGRTLEVDDGGCACSEELLQKRVKEAVDEALQCMREEHDSALRRLRQRREEERQMLIAAIDEEISTTEESERQKIDQKLRAQTREQEVEATKRTIARPSPTSVGVPLKLLQQRLASIEASYSYQIQELEADLMSLNSALRTMGEGSANQNQQPPKVQHPHTVSYEVCAEAKQDLGYVTSAGKCSLPSGRRETSHSALFSSEARLFLAGQLRDFSARRDALQAAREEWYTNAMSGASPTLVNSDPKAETTGLTAAHSRMISLAGSLHSRLERIMRRVNALQDRTDVKPFSPFSSLRRRRHKSDGHGDADVKLKGKKHRHKASLNGRNHNVLIQKWSRILSSLSSPSVVGGDLSALAGCI